MGGIWVLITAESAQQIEARYPALKVVEVGDREWITEEKYAEIRERWIPPSTRFDISSPTGWLRDAF